MTAARVSLRSLLRLPGVGHTLTASMVGRLALTSIGLLVILRVRDLDGSYAEGGLVVGAFSLALAVCAPLVGRLVDAHGQTVVLSCCSIAGSLPLAAIALVPDRTPIPAVAALAALAGAVAPSARRLYAGALAHAGPRRGSPSCGLRARGERP